MYKRLRLLPRHSLSTFHICSTLSKILAEINMEKGTPKSATYSLYVLSWEMSKVDNEDTISRFHGLVTFEKSRLRWKYLERETMESSRLWVLQNSDVRDPCRQKAVAQVLDVPSLVLRVSYIYYPHLGTSRQNDMCDTSWREITKRHIAQILCLLPAVLSTKTRKRLRTWRCCLRGSGPD